MRLCCSGGLAAGKVPGRVSVGSVRHQLLAFTMTVYQHVMPGMQAQAAATFSAAVFGE